MLDDFERALKVETADQDYAKGVGLIYQRLFDTLKQDGPGADRNRRPPVRPQSRTRRCSGWRPRRRRTRPFSKNSRGAIISRQAPPARHGEGGGQAVTYESRGEKRLLRSPRCGKGGRRSRISRAPTASWRCSTTPTAIPSDPRRRGEIQGGVGSLQRAERPAETRRLRPLRPRRPARRRRGTGFNPDAFADFSDILGDFFGFGDLFGGGGGGGGRRARSAARTSATTWKSSFEEAVFGMNAEIQVPRLETLRPLHRLRRRARQQLHHLPHLPRPRARFSTSRAFSPSGAPAAPAEAPARSSAIPARSAAARATARRSAS